MALIQIGSNGEAPHLTHEERILVIQTVRSTLDVNGYQKAVIIAGCGAQSTIETVQLCKEAKEAGAGWALVLSPSYWSKFIPRAVVKYEDVRLILGSWCHEQTQHQSLFYGRCK